MTQRIELLLIDPQNDFCWTGINLQGKSQADIQLIKSLVPEAALNPGSLLVQGADQDMIRVAKMIDRIGSKLYDIHVTVDSHHFVDISHPIFWINSKGEHPDVYTIITPDDVKNGVWRTTEPAYQKRATDYVNALEANGRYPLCIWPPHCLIGSWGHNVHPELYTSLVNWEKEFAMVDYVTKGSNFLTEHYSAVKADVPDPDDPSTQLNWTLIETLQKADIILLAGEARSHCLAYTVTDTADNFGEENIKKMVLLTDATSDVTGFEQYGQDFVSKMTARGMQLSTTVDFLR